MRVQLTVLTTYRPAPTFFCAPSPATLGDLKQFMRGRLFKLPVILWLLAMAIGVGVLANSRFQADMSVFMPRHPTQSQAVLVHQLQEGAASKVVLIGVDGLVSNEFEATSVAFADALRASPLFTFVANGRVGSDPATQKLLFDYRYLLSDAVNAQRFSVDGLKQSLALRASELAGSAGLMTAQLVASDPTGETLHIVDSLAAGYVAKTDSTTAIRNGLWGNAAGTRAVLIAVTRAPGTDLDALEIALKDVRERWSALPGRPAAAKLLLAGAPMMAVQSRAAIRDDSSRLAIIGSVMIAMLLGWLYRSPRLLLLGLLPVLTGIVIGLAAVGLGFSMIHGMTVGFGITLIGEAVDYAIYLFIQRPHDEAGGAGAVHAGRALWRTIGLGVATSVAGFATLLLSDFQGLAQLGLFTIAGLTAAAVVTRWVLPPLMPKTLYVRETPRLAATLQRIVALLQRIRWWMVAIAFALPGAVLLTLHKPLFSHELLALSPIPQSLQKLDASLRADLPMDEAGQLIALNGPDEQALLESCERVVTALIPLVERAVIAGYDAPCKYLPSARTQVARQASLPERAALGAALVDAAKGSPFNPAAFKSFMDSVETSRTLPPLTSAQLAVTALGAGYSSLMTHGKPGENWRAITTLRGLKPSVDGSKSPVEAVSAALAPFSSDSLVKVLLLSVKTESDALYQGYLRETLRWSAIGLLCITVLLTAALRSPWRALKVLWPLALSGVTTAAALVLLGAELNLLHIVGLLLIVAVGSNYALFFTDSASASSQNNPTLLVSLFIANTTTLLGFGLLAFSSVPVLNALGSTVGLGAFLALVFSAAFGRRSPRKAPSYDV